MAARDNRYNARIRSLDRFRDFFLFQMYMLDNPPTLDILFEDESIVVVSKPAQMLVHRTEIANGDTVFAVQCVRNQTGRRVWPVHRLDRGTSGVLVFAFDSEMASLLGKSLMAGDVGKRYTALTRGWITNPVRVDHALVPPVDPYLKHRKVEAQEASTIFTPVVACEVPVKTGSFETTRLGLVSAELLTGRRHQIRRHLKWLAHPIVGDATYGKGPLNRALAAYFGVDRLMLHCDRMRFRHPKTGEVLDISAPYEERMAKVLTQIDALEPAQQAAARDWVPVPRD